MTERTESLSRAAAFLARTQPPAKKRQKADTRPRWEKAVEEAAAVDAVILDGLQGEGLAVEQEEEEDPKVRECPTRNCSRARRQDLFTV